MREGVAARAGRWSAQNRWKAIGLWLAFVVAALALGAVTGFETLDREEGGSGESGQADELMNEYFPDVSEEAIVIRSDSYSVDDGDFNLAVTNLTNELATVPGLQNVLNPYVSQIDSTKEVEGVFSDDRDAALITYEIPEPPDEEQELPPGVPPPPEVKPVDEVIAEPLRIVAEFNAANEGTFEAFEFGSASFDRALEQSYEEDFQKSETLALIITLAVLILVFGAVIAALVPLVLGVTAVAAALGLLGVVSQVVPFDEAAQSVVFLIGLAVAVDYALFYIRREREERARGASSLDAIQTSAATSGRAIVISGLTVAVAMSGMLIATNATFTSFALGTVLVVLISVVGSLTVLPAILALLGDRVNRLRIPFLKTPEERAGSESRIWGAIVDRVMARPLVFGGIAVVFLLLLALPVLGMKMSEPGVHTLTGDQTVVEAYDVIQEEFPGDQIAATIAISIPIDAGAPAELQPQIEELERQAKAAGVALDDLVIRSDPRLLVLAIDVPIPGDGTDDTSIAALRELREELIPATLGTVPGIEYPVTGVTAATVDFSDLMKDRIWFVFAFVLGLAFLLLLFAFRSIVIPIKAIILNLLSVGAAYGVLVWGFQDGHLEGLLGFESTGAIVSWLPLFLFVVLFGLSMDYHVFILSRVREAYEGGMSSEEAVAHGIRTTASVVTAAAFVMVAVFAVFATLSAVEFKQTGVGLAVAILIDATVIRGVLLPASMKLLGDWNWYLPSWLEWMPRLSVDREAKGADDA